MTAHIRLHNVDIFGVDTIARAASFRQWFIKRQKLRPLRVPILSGITLNAKSGDRIALVGVNGSGKSSLMKVISGNYPIHAGTREVQGSIMPLIEMGVGFEQEVSGRANIKLSFAYRGRLRNYSREIEEKIIEFSELGDKIDAPFKNYSSGMAIRLAFSSAIFQDPDILLLDEILATGDAGFAEKTKAKIREKMDRAGITVVASHNQSELIELCNRFVLMHGGRIINEGSAREIFSQYHKDILHLPGVAA